MSVGCRGPLWATKEGIARERFLSTTAIKIRAKARKRRSPLEPLLRCQQEPDPVLNGLTGAHRAIGFALDGEAGHRLASELDMPTSADTLLRRVKGAPEELAPPPRHVGIDDWALRKWQYQGTVRLDLERVRVIGLLPAALTKFAGQSLFRADYHVLPHRKMLPN